MQISKKYYYEECLLLKVHIFHIHIQMIISQQFWYTFECDLPLDLDAS